MNVDVDVDVVVDTDVNVSYQHHLHHHYLQYDIPPLLRYLKSQIRPILRQPDLCAAPARPRPVWTCTKGRKVCGHHYLLVCHYFDKAIRVDE